MRTATIFLVVGGIALAVLIAGGLAIWMEDEELPALPAEPAAEPAAESSWIVDEPETPPPPRPPRETAPAPAPTAPVLQPVPTLPQAQPQPQPAPATNETAEAQPGEADMDWNAKIQEILNSEQSEPQMAQQLMALLPTMPEENRVETAQLMAGLMPDANYSQIIPLLTSTETDGGVLDALMVDLLDRPTQLQLPLFLQIAQNQGHPRHGEAREYLELYLDQDLGSDWSAWQQAVQRYIQENPE